MAYIGFLLIMIGLAATGAALDGKGDIVCGVAMTIGGAWMMWLFREEDEDGEEKDDGPDACGGGTVDKPAGESAGGCGADQTCGRGTGDPDADNGVSSRDSYRGR